VSRYTGKERDAESGLDYFGARYYASNMGRWMSPDWSAKAQPVPYAKLDNPQSLNLYAYVFNSLWFIETLTATLSTTVASTRTRPIKSGRLSTFRTMELKLNGMP
jgi:RHS repeat-associated protein